MIVDHNKNIQNSTLDLLNPKPKVPENDPLIPQFDERYYNEMCRRVNLKNSEMHSLRCDLSLKFWVAEKFKGETFYFPHNLDFRGRAYPVPPNLNHLGTLPFFFPFLLNSFLPFFFFYFLPFLPYFLLCYMLSDV
jgi:hypothetical protein